MRVLGISGSLRRDSHNMTLLRAAGELVEEHGAGRLVAPGDPRALVAAIGELLADPEERERLAGRSRAAAAGPYSWDSIAQRTIAVYEEVLAR